MGKKRKIKALKVKVLSNLCATRCAESKSVICGSYYRQWEGEQREIALRVTIRNEKI
jgi:hypothetical protein